MKKRKQNFLPFVLLIVLIVIALSFFLAKDTVLLAPIVDKAQEIIRDASDKVIEEEFVLSSTDLEEIQQAKNAIPRFGNGIPDYSELYNFLETRKGNIEIITLICKEFNPIFCLKKACQQNPELREQLSNELGLRINEEYGNKLAGEKLDSFIRNHKEECLLGIPQFAY